MPRTAVAAAQCIITNNPGATCAPSATRHADLQVGDLVARSPPARRRTVRVAGHRSGHSPRPAAWPCSRSGSYIPTRPVWPTYSRFAAQQFNGKTLCVGGRITTDEDKPTTLARDPSTVTEVD